VRWRGLLPVLAAALLASCIHRPILQLDPGAPRVELSQVPFHPQTEFHCGPAALATLLGADGIAVTPAQLAAEVFVPGLSGSLQAEMIASARRHDRLPVRLPPRPESLYAALVAGQPVLVLQNLGLESAPRWHYAVVVGFDPQTQDVVLRSGTTARQVLPLWRFLATWTLADRWALVLLAPDRVPDHVTTGDWLAAAAPFESLGRIGIAHRAFEAAVRAAPASALAWQALANTRYARGEVEAAEQALREALIHEPQSAAARNNLASLLLARGCPAAARNTLDALSAVPASLAAVIAQTRAEIAAAPAGEASDCPS
jgi:tetratricopeptide (TPR) repeat protein